MKEKKKKGYSMWQNTAFMVRAVCNCKAQIAIVLCIALGILGAGVSVLQMLITPMLLEKVETVAPLGELLFAIAAFSLGLIVLSALKTYLEQGNQSSYLSGRLWLLIALEEKLSVTSYPNTMDTDLLRRRSQADDACAGNNRATEEFWRTWTRILTNVFCFIAYLFLLSGLHPLLAVSVIFTSVFGYFVSNRINGWGYRHREEENEIQNKRYYVSKVVLERKYGKDIRLFGLRPWIEEVWDGIYRAYQAFAAKRERIYLCATVLDAVLAFLRNGIAYAYLIWLTLIQGLPVSQFLLYFGVASGFSQWVTGLLSQFSELHRESLEISVVREVLEWPEPFLFEGGKPLVPHQGKAYELKLEHVSFRYPGAKKDTLRDLDLTIRPGEKVAIVGLNGAGKTTLVKLLSGFLDPTQGRVLLNGEDIRQFNRRDYYQLFTAVFQDFSILEASVAENVAQQVEGIDMEKVRRCIALAGLTEKMESLPQKLDTKVGRRVFEDGMEFSGGEVQRLMLARALYKDAPILLLDEPTAALDPIAESNIYQAYNEMTQGRTSLFISHRLASTRFCDRILFLADGAIVEEGTHEELLALGGGYAELFQVQSRYYREGEQEHEE